MSTETRRAAFQGLDHLDAAYRAARSALRSILEPRHAFIPPGAPPDLSLDDTRGRPIDDVVAEIDARVLSHSINHRHKLALAHMVPPPATISLIGDLLVGALNQCAFVWEEAPMAAPLERECIRWMARRLGYGEGGGGLLTSGGTMSNILAAYLALAEKSGGRDDIRGRCCLVASDQAHFSLDKASALLGLSPGGIVRAETDRSGRLRPGAVADAASRGVREGRVPFLFVCTAGTTNCGTMESAEEYIDIARAHGAWCHIDAAHGGMMALSMRGGRFIDRWGDADSISWDPHKSLYVSYAVGALLLRRRASLDPLEFHSEYALKEEEEEIHAGGWHLEGSRRFEALKLWMTIRHFGEEGLAELVDHTLDLAAGLAGLLARERNVELMTEPDTNIVCFRVVRWDWPEELNDGANAALQRELFRSGGPLLSATRIAGRTLLRCVVLNPLLEHGDLPAIVERIVAAGRRSLSDTFYRENEHHESPACYQPASRP